MQTNSPDPIASFLPPCKSKEEKGLKKRVICKILAELLLLWYFWQRLTIYNNFITKLSVLQDLENFFNFDQHEVLRQLDIIFREAFENALFYYTIHGKGLATTAK
jgi:hypothetical protein